MTNFKEDILRVKAFVFDCDGVLTDCTVITLPSGEALRVYNAKDGFAVALAVKRGYKVCIISGGVGEAMQARFERLEVSDIYLGCKEKLKALNEFAAKYDLSMDDILYMGDDVPDVEPMMAVGVTAAPKDAAIEVKQMAKYISNLDGGKGCVRDVIEQVLRAQKKWAQIGSERDIMSI
ncbi:MAG: HAD hydrolase family protein [Rikenellaceae bacterium]